MVKRPGDLVSACDAGLRNAVGLQSCELAAFKKHLSTGRREMPAHHVDEGRLAGAVGAEQAENFTFVHLQAHTVAGLHTLEGLGQVLHVQQRSDERRVGNKCVSTDRSRRSPSHSTKKNYKT